MCIEPAIDVEFGILDEVEKRGGIGAAGRWCGKVPLDALTADGDKFRQDQEVLIRGVCIEAMDRQNVGSRTKRSREVGNVELFIHRRLFIRLGRRSGRIPYGCCWCIAPRDFLSVEIGDKPVIMLHSQSKRFDDSGILDVEFDPRPKRGVHAEHFGANVGLHGVAESGNRQPAVGRVADQFKVVVESPLVSLRREQFDAAAAAPLIVDKP